MIQGFTQEIVNYHPGLLNTNNAFILNIISDPDAVLYVLPINMGIGLTCELSEVFHVTDSETVRADAEIRIGKMPPGSSRVSELGGTYGYYCLDCIARFLVYRKRGAKSLR